ncbi:MAG: DVU0298 family protein [bacterium]
MSGSTRKRLLEALKSQDWPSSLENLEKDASRGLVSQAVAALSNPEPMLRWRAVEAVGFLVSKLMREDKESARDVIRRLLWSLNEESGSIGWGAPEALAEILAREKGLAQEFLPIFVSFLKTDDLMRMPEGIARGFLWGVFRLGELYQDELGKPDVLDSIKAFLASADSSTRGMAVLALKKFQSSKSLEGAHNLSHDQGIFTFMDQGKIHHMSISEVLNQ